MRSPAEVVLEVLAPGGYPIFEWAHEETPASDEMDRLVEDILSALMGEGWRFVDRICSLCGEHVQLKCGCGETHFLAEDHA